MTYGNRNPQPKRKVGEIVVEEYYAHIILDEGGAYQVDHLTDFFPRGRYEITEVVE